MNVQNHDLALRMAELAQVISLRRVDDVLVDVTAAAKELIAGVDIAGPSEVILDPFAPHHRADRDSTVVVINTTLPCQ